MKKVIIFLGMLWLLVGCAPVAAATPTAQPINALVIATPVVGSATVLPVAGKDLLTLHRLPSIRTAITGEVKPGDTGRALGVEATGKWMLVEINKQTGWLPIQYLDYTIAD